MISFKLLFFFFVVCTNNLPINALLTEGLLSNYLAEPHQFTYHVALMGKKNGTNEKNLKCSAGIIASNLILTAAQCFIDTKGRHRKLTYSILVDTIDINNREALEIPVDIIYLISDDPFYVDDIAVGQLAENLDLDNNTYLSKLIIPDEMEDFQDKEGIVAGYGNNWIPIQPISGIRERLVGDTDGLLRYLKVRILDDTIGIMGHSRFNFITQFFGIASGGIQKQMWGLCDYDAGSPLVFGNKIVGIASSRRVNCDDTIFGGLYTNVSEYTSFIHAILSGQPEDDTLIYRNRQHVA